MWIGSSNAHGWPGEVHEGECEMGFDFGVKRVSLSLSLSLSPLHCRKWVADVRISCVSVCCVCRVCVSWHWLFPSFLKSLFMYSAYRRDKQPIARKSTPQSSSVLNASESCMMFTMQSFGSQDNCNSEETNPCLTSLTTKHKNKLVFSLFLPQGWIRV
jgi:hypothetical protein